MITRIVIILLSLILLLLVVVWGVKQMVSYTPDYESFHTPSGPVIQTPVPPLEEPHDPLTTDPSPGPHQVIQPVLSADRQEVIPYILEYLEDDYQSEIKPAITAHRVSVQQGRVIAELIIETDHLPLENLSSQGQGIAIKLKELAQRANLERFYIKFQSTPIIENGLIIFPSDSRVTLGKVVLPWDNLQQKYGKIDTLQLAAFGLDSMAISNDDVLVWPLVESPHLHGQ